MTDDLPDLTPAETERVRRLLAEARHTDPVPVDVAARLDRTLATLVGQQRDLQARTVSSLAARRRRRATQLLVAAVAVVAVGVGVGRLVSGMDTGEVGASSDSAAEGSETDQDAAPHPSAESGAESAPQGSDAKAALPRVDDGTFEADAEAARRSRTGADSATGSLSAVGCDRESWGQGDRVMVRYHGDRAALVFRPDVRGTQVVDLFACDGDVVLRSGSVPVP